MDIEKEVFEGEEDVLPKEFEHMSADSVAQRARLLENEIRVLKDEATRLQLDQNSMREKVKENKEKVKLNNQLPYLVSGWVEAWRGWLVGGRKRCRRAATQQLVVWLRHARQPSSDCESKSHPHSTTGWQHCGGAGHQARGGGGGGRRNGRCVCVGERSRDALMVWRGEAEGCVHSWQAASQQQPRTDRPARITSSPAAAGPADLDSQRQGKCVVLKTSTRQTIFLPVVGLVDADTLRPGGGCVGGVGW
jgi:ATP-dependent 26S proteasome regulatory subunit